MEQPSTPRVGRPATLSKERIVATALEAGTARLTVRGLAKRLGVSHAALYRWVSNRDDLLDLVSDALLDRAAAEMNTATKLGDAEGTGTVEAHWRSWLHHLAHALRSAFLPDVHAPGRVQFPRATESYARLRDQACEAMCSDGFTVSEAARPDMTERERHFDLFLTTFLRGLRPAR